MSDDFIVEPILQPVSEDLTKEMNYGADQLKGAAGRFLAGVRKVVQQQSHVRVLLNSARQMSVGASLAEVKYQMSRSTEVTRQLSSLQYAFEGAINKFLGRKILLLFIEEDGTMLYKSEFAARAVYARATKNSGRGDISLSKEIKSTFTDFPKQVSDKMKEIIQERTRLYQPVREEVINRWEQNHQSNNPWVKGNKDLLDTFYWLNGTNSGGKQWGWSKKMNRGRIFEAYANLIWEQKEVKNFSSDKEEATKQYWEFMSSHNLIDGVPAITKGDVTAWFDSNLQFAVKSGTFHTAAISNYLTTAYEIYYGHMEINKDTVLTLLDNIHLYTNTIKDYGLQKAEERLDGWLANAGLLN